MFRNVQRPTSKAEFRTSKTVSRFASARQDSHSIDAAFLNQDTFVFYQDVFDRRPRLFSNRCAVFKLLNAAHDLEVVSKDENEVSRVERRTIDRVLSQKIYRCGHSDGRRRSAQARPFGNPEASATLQAQRLTNLSLNFSSARARWLILFFSASPSSANDLSEPSGTKSGS